MVRRNYPASPQVADASYKTAMCYYNLSPKPSLDQQYTRKAIDEFQSFVEYFPANANAADADAKIRELTTRLAKKQYDTARLYSTMQSYRSALFYFDDVIEKYHDTEYAPRFLDKYPNSVLRGRMESLKKDIDRELPSPSVKGESGSGGKGMGL